MTEKTFEEDTTLIREDQERYPVRNLARFEVDFEFLRQFLLLPKDAKILGVERLVSATDYPPRRFEIYVEHPDLPKVEAGCEAVRIMPTYTRKKEQVVFESWGIE